ncbi:MAG: hypothetical protein ACI353_06710 [Alloprevotella sp.]
MKKMLRYSFRVLFGALSLSAVTMVVTSCSMTTSSSLGGTATGLTGTMVQKRGSSGSNTPAGEMQPM